MSPILFLIKIFHTLIWAFVSSCIFYILYCGITLKFNKKLYWAIGITILEGLILLYFGWVCPLTILAENYVETPTLGFDIFLPKWFVPYNKTFFTSLFILGILLIIINYLRRIRT